MENLQLVDVAGELTILCDRAAALAKRASGTLSRRPAPDEWSAAECLEHLTLTTLGYLPIWEAALTRGRQEQLSSGKKRFRADLKGRVLAWLLEPPYTRKMPTIEEFFPAENLDGAKAIHAFELSQGKLLTILQMSDGLPVDKLRIQSPFDENIRYSVWSSYLIVVAHQRRHLWQAARAVGGSGIEFVR